MVDAATERAIVGVLRDLGCTIREEGELLVAERTGPLKPIKVETQPFPGFPTDMQAQIMAATALADGVRCPRRCG